MRRWLPYLMALIAGMAFAVPGSAAPRIGVASVVKNQVTGTIGGSTRTLNRGAGVFQNETVATGSGSSAQIMFVDQTTMTLSADARIVLDRFVYNPQKSSGDIVLNVVKGAFRFVTGAADPNSYKIKTPLATLSIRGTIIEGYIDIITGFIFIVVVEGSITVDSGGEIVTVAAGNFIVIRPGGDIIEGGDWIGPMLNLDAGIQFIFDNQGRFLDQGGDVLPKWNNLNEALDARDIDLLFPPSPSDPGTGGGIGAPPPIEGFDGPPGEGYQYRLNSIEPGK